MTKSQRVALLMKKAWIAGIVAAGGTTGTRDTRANDIQLNLHPWRLSNAWAARKWPQMRADVVES